MAVNAKEKRRRFLLRVAGARDNKVYIGPEVVSVHVTNRCNLRCGYCWHHSPGNPAHKKRSQDMSFDKFKRLIKDCEASKVDAIHFSGEGEPTMHSRFAEMMALMRKKGFYTLLLTNGTFPVSAYPYVEMADSVIINLGAADRETYCSLQGADLFDRVLSNIAHLVEFRDRHKPDLTVNIGFVINQKNVLQQRKMRRLAASLGVDALMESPMSADKYNQAISLGRQSNTEGEVLKQMQPLCFNGWFDASIALDGRVGMCCHIGQMEIANINKKSFRKIWFSDDFMQMREFAKAGKIVKRFKECEHCSAYKKGRNLELAKKFLQRTIS